MNTVLAAKICGGQSAAVPREVEGAGRHRCVPRGSEAKKRCFASWPCFYHVPPTTRAD
jgi:hypothetical protein